MSSVRFIFTADSHLRGSSMGSVERGVDFFRALLSVVHIAEKQGVRDILHGGDILDTTRLTSQVSEQLQEIDLACREAGIRMHVISGNHDACKPHWIESIRKVRERLSDKERGGIYLVDNQTISIGDAKKGDTLRVLCLPSMPSDVFLQRATADTENADVLLWHGPIREFCGYPDPTALSITDLPTNIYAAILLGDIHIREFKTHNDCLVGYPGATEVAKSGDPIDCTCSLMEWDRTRGMKVVENIPVANRPVYPRRLDSEEKVQAVMQELRQIKNKPALFLINYADSLEDVRTRLNMVAGPNTLVRSRSYTIGDAVSLASAFGFQAAQMDAKPPEAFLQGIVPPDSDIGRTAAILLNPDADHATVLRDFVDRLEPSI